MNEKRRRSQSILRMTSSRLTGPDRESMSAALPRRVSAKTWRGRRVFFLSTAPSMRPSFSSRRKAG